MAIGPCTHATLVFLEQLVADYRDPANGPITPIHRSRHPEVAMDVSAACARLLAMTLDFQSTGQIHLEPSPEAVLAATVLADGGRRHRAAL